MKRYFNLVLLLAAALLHGCSSNGINLKQNVSGKAGEIVIVANKAQWEGAPGAELRRLLASEYPLLPQREASFTLINIPENAFSNIFQIHRNIIILQVSDNFKEAEMEIRADVWSSPQTVLSLTAPTMESADSLIKAGGEKIFNLFEQAERNRIIRASKRYEEKSLRLLVADMFGGSPYFPTGYSLKKRAGDFVWISYETTYTNQGIFVYKVPVTDSTSLTADSLVAIRNRVLEMNVPGMFEGSYMTTSIIEGKEPQLKWIKYKGRTFGELRGLWEVKNDYMGGPFIDHVFYDRAGKNLIFLECFVYAPRYDKRNYLRQVESIIYSFEWEEDFSR